MTDQQFAPVQRIAGNLPVEQRAAFIEKAATTMPSTPSSSPWI
jgi:hypothetical protein